MTINAPHNKGNGKAAQWLYDRATHSGDDCLIYPFARSRQKGYGFLGHNGQHQYAHRFMCELANGPAPTPEHQAAHSCGKGHTGCVNPRHLRWATNSENQLERRAHGTGKPPNQPKRKLTVEQIAEVRALKGKVTQYELAQRFGVKTGSIEYWQSHDKPPAATYLTPETVRAIRAIGKTRPQRETARQFGIDDNIVNGIVNGRIYKHVS